MSVLASAVGQVPFTEEAATRGMHYVGELGGGNGDGSGVAVTDLDGDGDMDIVLTGRSDGVVGLYENLGKGVFIDRSSQSGIPPLIASAAVTAADYDGDGALDLYFTLWGAGNVLVRNLGGFQFQDVTAQAGVGDDGIGTGATFADYDKDGWLDLYVSNYFGGSSRNRLYHNLGNGTFEEIGQDQGVDDAGAAYQSVFFDYDRDGDPDLYVANDKGYVAYPNRLWQNNDGVFQDISEASGTGAQIDSMGIAVGDLDGNGYPDLYVTNTPQPPGNPLFMNQGDGTFMEQSDEAGVADDREGWGALFFDYDNNGFQDLYVANGATPNRLYEYNGALPCIDVAPDLGVASDGISFCIAVGDIDDDGDLDLLLQDHQAPIQLFINHEGEQRNWLKIKLFGAGPNTHAVGALVDVTAGSQTQHREVMTGVGYKSSSSLVLHFGLGAATIVDVVSILWPGGSQTFLVNVPVNQKLTLVEAACPQDLDDDGTVGASDLAILLGDWGPNPGHPADFNGDGSVGPFDLAQVLGHWGPCP